MPGELRAKGRGIGEPVLILLHGLGATAEVWDGWSDFLLAQWPGQFMAVDLPGHGSSPPLRRYSFADMAGAVADVVPDGARTVVLGHSLGGAIGLALASGWYGVRVTGVVGLGIKVVWSVDELHRAAALATRPVAWYDSREEAADRYLRVAGLTGLWHPSDPHVSAGLVDEDGKWRLALDPAAFGVGAPDMRGLLAASRAHVVLARGEHDPLVSDTQLAELVPDHVVLPGLGHNAHVENPRAVAKLLAPLAR